MLKHRLVLQRKLKKICNNFVLKKLKISAAKLIKKGCSSLMHKVETTKSTAFCN